LISEILSQPIIFFPPFHSPVSPSPAISLFFIPSPGHSSIDNTLLSFFHLFTSLQFQPPLSTKSPSPMASSSYANKIVGNAEFSKDPRANSIKVAPTMSSFQSAWLDLTIMKASSVPASEFSVVD